MSGVLSKLIGDVLGCRIETANCYELHHTWNPSCNGAIRDAMWDGCTFSFKTYITVYVLGAILSKRDLSKIDWATLFKDICRSTAFLLTNLAGYMWFMCRLRQLMGFSILPTMGLINGFLAAYLAILIEAPKRRPLLSLYLTNLASETLYRQLANHGYVPLIRRGQIIIFAIGLVGLTYMLQRRQLSRNISALLNFSFCLNNKNEECLSAESLQRSFKSPLLRALLFLRTFGGKHRLCTHKHSCVSRSTEAFARNFTYGLGLSWLLVLLQNLRFILRRPTRLIAQLLSYKSLRLPLFLGLMPLLYQGSNCLVHRLLDTDTTQTRMLSAFLSSLAMFFYPSVSVAMYILWKFFEAYYFDLVNRGILRTVPYGDILLYTLSTGYVLWCVTIEPHAIRKGYWDFLSKLTGGKVALMNRRLYDLYGFRSSSLFPNFVPKLNPKFITINPATYLKPFEMATLVGTTLSKY